MKKIYIEYGDIYRIWCFENSIVFWPILNAIGNRVSQTLNLDWMLEFFSYKPTTSVRVILAYDTFILVAV